MILGIIEVHEADWISSTALSPRKPRTRRRQLIRRYRARIAEYHAKFQQPQLIQIGEIFYANKIMMEAIERQMVQASIGAPLCFQR